MINRLRALEEEKKIQLGFISIGSYGKSYFLVVQTGEIIVENDTDAGIPDGVAKRLMRAFPLDSERRSKLIERIRERPYTLAP